jgi:outer membrane protein insertion porin family
MSSFKKTVPSMLMAFISCSALAYAEGEKLVEIRIQGNRRIEAAAILNTIKMRAGDTLSDDKTDADIRAIYKLGHFQDVQALKEESDKGVVLVYLVRKRPSFVRFPLKATRKSQRTN